MPYALSSLVAIATGLAQIAPMSTSIEGYVGVAYTAEIIPTAVLARVGAGLRGEYLGADLFFEKSVAHYGSADEACPDLGATGGGCLYAPTILAGQVSLTPYRRRHVEVMGMVSSGWARRKVFLHSDERRDDWVVGGGLGINFLWLPVVVSLQSRYLRYATFAPSGFGNTNAVTLLLNVGGRFEVW